MLPANDLGPMNIQCLFCYAFHWIEERVSSSSIRNPEFESCCQRGKVKLPALRVPPTELYNLFVDDSPQARDFRKNIVQYNAAMAFTLLGVKIDRSFVTPGPPVFCIHGELKHLSGSLLPERDVNPSYAQLYIYDSHAAYEFRVSRNGNLSLQTLLLLQQVMRDYNPYTDIYQHAYEILRIYNAPDYTIRLCVVPGHDPRWYNLPSADEVGVILPGENRFQGDYWDIVLHLRPRYYPNPHDG